MEEKEKRMGFAKGSIGKRVQSLIPVFAVHGKIIRLR